jgi:RNA polymerase sigma factor (sigma-70 family)
MPKLGLNGVLDWLRRRVLVDVPCGELVERYVAHAHDADGANALWGSKAEDAFAELVRRHGPKVYGVCRRILGDHQLAEDAFQATFVVLAKKAHTIQPPSAVGGFLFGVARKAALKAYAMTRRHKEKRSHLPEDLSRGEPAPESDVMVMLDEEIANLSEVYRSAVVLCELDGATRAEAAKQLGIAEGTLSSRLAAARKQLRKRLAKRGVALSVGMMAALADSAQGGVPLPLTASTAEIMASSLPQSVSTIAEGVLQMMILSKLKSVSMIAAAFVLASGMGLGVLAARDGFPQVQPQNPNDAHAVIDPAPPEPPKAAPQDDPAPKKAAKGPSVYPLAILGFEERGAGVKDLGPKVNDLLVVRLSARPELQLVDRGDIKKVLEELELNLSGAVKTGDATRVSQLTGAKIMITGSVQQIDKRLYLIAKVIGTETTRVFATSVDGPTSDELGPLVDQLGEKIAETVGQKAEEMVPKPMTRSDRLANLKDKMKKGKRPSVMVRIPERHIGQAVPDPAAQTELMLMLTETGFGVLDPEEASKGKAEILITGDGVSEFAIRRGNLISVKARVEVKATDRKTGKVLVSDSQTAIVIDLTEQLAGKAALQEAAAILAERIVPKLQAP